MDTQSIKSRYSIIGSSPALDRNIEIAVQVAKTNLNVLISGENGTGKDVFSHIIHDYSSRKHEQFFAINCGALPEGTIDSELFGHVKGSFTGATADRKGYFELANKGTIFLDEVGEMPLPTQARLLRILEKGEFIKVGGEKIERTNVRVVAATNVNLPEAIAKGKFRQDLYYRLNVIEIKMPALRERRDDIPLLFRKFAMEFAEGNQMPVVRLTPDANEVLKQYYWGGNIRQLRNITEQICLLEVGHEVNGEVLRQYLPQNEINLPPALRSQPSQTTASGAAMSDIEREQLKYHLAKINQDIEQLRREIDELRGQQTTQPSMTTPIYGPANDLPQNTIRMTTSHDDYEQVEEWKEEEPKSMREMERMNIEKALIKYNGSRKQAANELGISERTLYRKIKAYDLE